MSLVNKWVLKQPSKDIFFKKHIKYNKKKIQYVTIGDTNIQRAD